VLLQHQHPQLQKQKPRRLFISNQPQPLFILVANITHIRHNITIKDMIISISILIIIQNIINI
jgi:hypothetical protein